MWTKGSYKGYTFQVKHYDEPSAEFGLNGGRISKLWIADANRRTVYNYDRGEDIPATTDEAREVLDYVVTMYN